MKRIENAEAGRMTAALLVAALAGTAAGQVTSRVSLSTSGAQANGGVVNPEMSVAGRYVAFSSAASNLVSGDTNGFSDVFVRDRQLGTTERVSLSTSGAQANGSVVDPNMSVDGRYVAFVSAASNLVSGD